MLSGGAELMEKSIFAEASDQASLPWRRKCALCRERRTVPVLERAAPWRYGRPLGNRVWRLSDREA